MDDFLIRSLAAGILMVLVAAPMGCLMVWQRLAFLADTLGHASVLGVALGLVLTVNPMLGVVVVILLIMALIHQSMGRPLALSESVLAIISHTGLAAGILLLGIGGFTHISLESVLFGDLLATSAMDLLFLALTVMLLLGLLWRHWRAFVALSISPEIAQAEGVAVQRMNLMLYLMIALLISVMMKVMGVLLVGAMLVIPVNAARFFSRSPEQMALLSLFFGLLSLLGGMGMSWQFDLQTGPSIVVMASILLVLAYLVTRLRKSLT
jgi:zinc transport system permease protein